MESKIPVTDKTLLIYTPRITSRNRYIFRLIFADILNIPFSLTTQVDFFKTHKGPRFSYAKHGIDDEPFFYASELLFESGIVVQELNFIQFKGIKAFYPTLRSSALPFDPFAASFFMTSRYEEYLPHLKDAHGRFKPKQSVAYLNGFLDKAVVNRWAISILEVLENRFGKIDRKERSFRFIPTVDIDNAWAYKHKGFIRATAGAVGDLLDTNLKRLKERIQVLSLRKPDPYDTYDYMLNLFEENNLHPIFFILLGEYGPYDKNIPHQNKHLHSLIKLLADYGQVGIHPSYASNDKPELLHDEINRLSSIIHQEIHLSRQHFLRLNLPLTYQRLIESDITDDYTMGYADFVGFRAGMCTPFFFYDLDLEIETSLRLHPFAIMEGTLKDYMQVNPKKAKEIVKPIIEEIKKHNGDFVLIWHNESFSENDRWKGWRSLFEYIIDITKNT